MLMTYIMLTIADVIVFPIFAAKTGYHYSHCYSLLTKLAESSTKDKSQEQRAKIYSPNANLINHNDDMYLAAPHCVDEIMLCHHLKFCL